MREAHSRLIKIVKLIELNYGRDKVTPNLHLSLHLCECSYDYGPLYAFWCFSFESLEFRKPFGEGSLDAIIIRIKINQFGRCRIGSEFFGSVISSVSHDMKKFLYISKIYDE